MRKTVVVDTSIAIKWVLREPDSNIASALLAKWFTEGVLMLAPALFAYEVTNVLHQRIRKGDLTLDSAKQSLVNVLLTALELDFSKDKDNIRALELAQQYALPATYDAHYLALAEREQCEYWTADARLLNALKGNLPWVRMFLIILEGTTLLIAHLTD